MAKNKRYNKKFRLQAARLVTEQGYSLREAADKAQYKQAQGRQGRIGTGGNIWSPDGNVLFCRFL